LKREEEKKTPKDSTAYFRTLNEAKIKRNGAQAALEELSTAFGSDLFTKVPKIKECLSVSTIKGFTTGFPEDIKSATSTYGQSIIDELSVLRMLLPKLHATLVDELQDMYPHIVQAIQCNFSVIRFSASRCFTSMCKANITSGMKFMVEKILPMVADQLDLTKRQGAIECIYRTLSHKCSKLDLVTTLDTQILPYVTFLIVPVMGRMSDSDNDVRLLATETFATLVKLVPLEVFDLFCFLMIGWNS
jgi:TATA-binding protein-associated factor